MMQDVEEFDESNVVEIATDKCVVPMIVNTSSSQMRSAQNQDAVLTDFYIDNGSYIM